MLKNLLFVFSLCALAPVFNAGCQSVSVAPEVEVSDAVLRTAETFDFKYMDLLAKAKTGDVQSIQELIRFHKYVDDIEAINHAVTCLELIPFATDAKFSAACKMATPNMRKALAERLAQAQGKTKKEELRKPLKDWAPMTWAALNSTPGDNTAGTADRINDPKYMNMKKPGAENQPAPEATPAKPAVDAQPDRNGGGN